VNVGTAPATPAQLDKLLAKKDGDGKPRIFLDKEHSYSVTSVRPLAVCADPADACAPRRAVQHFRVWRPRRIGHRQAIPLRAGHPVGQRRRRGEEGAPRAPRQQGTVSGALTAPPPGGCCAQAAVQTELSRAQERVAELQRTVDECMAAER
jgi:hypothetical protein